MNISHINAYAKSKGYKDALHCITILYVEKDMPLEEVAEELEITMHSLRRLIQELHILKPKRQNPLTLDDAKRMGPDAIAVKYKVSRSTAWRWKRAILRLAPDLEESEEVDVPAAVAKLSSHDAPLRADGD